MRGSEITTTTQGPGLAPVTRLLPTVGTSKPQQNHYHQPMKKFLLLTAALACLLASLTTVNAQTFNIFPVDHVWKYMATASDTTFCLNGTGWETTGYDDSAWPSGPGGFTGGENTPATLTSLAGLLNTTTLPAPTP